MKKINFKETGLIGYHRYAIYEVNEIDDCEGFVAGCDSLKIAEDMVNKFDPDFGTREIYEVIK
jgi:hypothetical protein